MVFNDSIRGGIKGDVLLFSAYEKRSSDLDDYASKLGMIVQVKLEGGEGAAMLVRSSQAIAKLSEPLSLCYHWSDTLAKEVRPVIVLGDPPCGFSFPGLETLEVGDYFWLIVPGLGNPMVSLRAGGNIASGDYVLAAAGGECLQDPAFDAAAPGTSFGQSLTSAANFERVDVVLGYVKGLVAP